MGDVELVQTRAGQKIEITNKWGEKRSVTVGREWDVFRGGVRLGAVRYEMVTRERRSPGLRYVHARWQSPGWRYKPEGLGFWQESPSKKAAVESIVSRA